jgi:hypothetical protein
MAFAFGEGLMSGNAILQQQQEQKNSALETELKGKKLQMESAQLAQQEVQNRQKMSQDLFTQAVQTMQGIGEAVKNMPAITPGSEIDQALDRQKLIVAKLAGMIQQDPGVAEVMASTIRASVGQGIKRPESKVVGNQLVQPSPDGTSAQVLHTAPQQPPQPTELMRDAQFAFPGNQQAQRDLVAGARTKSDADGIAMKEAAKFFPNDPKAQQDYVTQARMRPNSTVTIDQRGELRADIKEGEVIGEEGADVIKERNRSAQAIEKMGVVKQLADQWKAQGGQLGSMAGTKIEVSKFMQSVGMDPAAVGLPANTDMGEALIAMSNEMAMGRIGGQGGMPANNFSEADRKFLIETVPNIENTERGFQTKLAIGARVAQRKMEAADIYEEARANKKSVSEALSEMRRQLKNKPLFDEEERKALMGIAKPQEKQIDFSKMDRQELLNMDAKALDPEQRAALKAALARKKQ